MTPKPGPPPAAGWTAFSICSVIWASTFLVIAIGNDSVPPVWGATLRLALAAVILFAIMALRRDPLPRGAALRTAVAFGFFQFGLNLPFLYLGEKEVSSGLSAVIFATIPLMTAFLARVYGLEPITRSRLLGALLALVGVAVIFSGQLTARVKPWPMAFVLLAAGTACFGTVTLKRGPRQSPVAANAVGAAVGGLVCLLWSRLLREPHALPAAWPAWVPVLYLAIASSVLAFVLMAWLVNHWDVSRISYIAVIVPVAALALGALVRHEQVGPASLGGSGVVLAGVVIGLELWRPRAAVDQ